MGKRFSSGSLLRVDPRWRDELGQPVVDADLPFGVVEQAVVDAAEHGAVVELGFAVVLPLQDMVDFAPGKYIFSNI